MVGFIMYTFKQHLQLSIHQPDTVDFTHHIALQERVGINKKTAVSTTFLSYSAPTMHNLPYKAYLFSQ